MSSEADKKNLTKQTPRPYSPSTPLLPSDDITRKGWSGGVVGVEGLELTWEARLQSNTKAGHASPLCHPQQWAQAFEQHTSQTGSDVQSISDSQSDINGLIPPQSPSHPQFHMATKEMEKMTSLCLLSFLLACHFKGARRPAMKNLI